MTNPAQRPTPSGLLIIDKPQSVTSFDVVAAVRAALHIKKVGHAGTLDPMATGVLIIAFGNATRLLAAIVEHDKTYEATIRLGRRTTTDDAEGDFIDAEGNAVAVDSPLPPVEAERLERIDDDTLRAIIAERFTGDIMQVPNAFSAIKIHGRRAYDLAREDKDVELAARPVNIAEFAVLGMERVSAVPPVAGGIPRYMRDHGSSVGKSRPTTPPRAVQCLDVRVRISCSSGTYIRALARDLGDALGVGGYLTRLRRTRVGRYALPDDSSGLLDGKEMAETRLHAVSAHAETKTFTNREGEAVSRNKCVLDLPDSGPRSDGLVAGVERIDQRPDAILSLRSAQSEARRQWLLERALTMEQAARGAMPCLAITAEEAVELRFGRRIRREVTDPAIAIVPGSGDVVAIVERADTHWAKPVTVFPAA